MSSETIDCSASDAAKAKYDLIYGLEDKPAPLQAVYGALQHLFRVLFYHGGQPAAAIPAQGDYTGGQRYGGE